MQAACDTGQDATELTADLLKLSVKDKRSIYRLLDHISSAYPKSVRRIAQMKAKIILRQLTDCEKEIVADYLADKLSYTTDTWEQRNIVEILSTYLDGNIERKVMSIIEKDHIDQRVRERGTMLFAPTSRKEFA